MVGTNFEPFFFTLFFKQPFDTSRAQTIEFYFFFNLYLFNISYKRFWTMVITMITIEVNREVKLVGCDDVLLIVFFFKWP